MQQPGEQAFYHLFPVILYTQDGKAPGNIYTVMIYHGRGMYSRWAHVNPVKARGYVAPGEVFARVMYKSRKSPDLIFIWNFLKERTTAFIP